MASSSRLLDARIFVVGGLHIGHWTLSTTEVLLLSGDAALGHGGEPGDRLALAMVAGHCGRGRDLGCRKQCFTFLLFGSLFSCGLGRSGCLPLNFLAAGSTVGVCSSVGLRIHFLEHSRL